ncbi:hypothetical protein TRIUR3_03612 [Triticum urartu]|uniref:RNase H type-1 domain-containing protein n=1 Tax=Triticum urartu TaxID=4572 RepID=M7ZNB8_TRIUA|nr:hypothetical protein TRIUR3_03612 [Triticum urartu]
MEALSVSKLIKDFKIAKIDRRANRVAHEIAKFSFDSRSEGLLCNSVPPCVTAFVMNDCSITKTGSSTKLLSSPVRATLQFVFSDMEDLEAFVKDSGFVEADDQTHRDLTSGYNIDEVDSSGGLDSHPLQVKLERRHARDYQRRRDDAGSESDIICVSAGRSKGGKKRTVSHTSNRRIISKKGRPMLLGQKPLIHLLHLSYDLTGSNFGTTDDRRGR